MIEFRGKVDSKLIEESNIEKSCTNGTFRIKEFDYTYICVCKQNNVFFGKEKLFPLLYFKDYNAVYVCNYRRFTLADNSSYQQWTIDGVYCVLSKFTTVHIVFV